MRLIGILVAASLFACGGGNNKQAQQPTAGSGSASASASASDSGPTTVESAVGEGFQMLDAVDDAIASQPDCPSKGHALQAWGDANQDLLHHIAQIMSSLPADQIQAEVQKQMPDQTKAQALFQDAQGCSNDPTFMAAWKSVSDTVDGGAK